MNWRSLTLLLTINLYLPAPAATNYVWQDSPNPTPPYTNWPTSAHTIQDAVDAAQPGDTVLVTNGVYTTGGRAVYGTMTNRVTVDKFIILQSCSGPEETIIAGASAPTGGSGEGAIRCVYLSSNAILAGFTLTNGNTHVDWTPYHESSGGGIFCEGYEVVSNCVLVGNAAYAFGGGAFAGRLYDCVLLGNSAHPWVGNGGGTSGSMVYHSRFVDNSAENGGGAYASQLFNCLLTNNYAVQAGAASGCMLDNCVLVENSAAFGMAGVNGGTLSNCLLINNYGVGATAATLYNCRISGHSSFAGAGASGCALYNCILTHNSAGWQGGGAFQSTLYNCTLAFNYAGQYGGGAFESTLYNCISYYNDSASDPNHGESILNYSCTLPLPTNGLANITNEPAFVNLATGDLHLSYGSPCIDAGTNLSAIITNDFDAHPRPLDGNGDGIAAFGIGAYEFVPPHYVWQVSPNPTPPYTDWPTAAHTIQDAVDAAQPGDTVLVTNGVYAAGGRAVHGTMTNRVTVDKFIILQSCSGPSETIIAGAQASTGSNGDGAIRCVYLMSNAVLRGFTLTNGHTRTTGDYLFELNGGGVFGMGSGALEHCTIIANSAFDHGGGAYNVILSKCSLINNSSGWSGGGAYGTELFQCSVRGCSSMFGGGVFGSVLQTSSLVSNWAGGGIWGWAEGGGSCRSTLYNCTLIGNFAGEWGGGADEGYLFNCLVAGNSAPLGGGTYDCFLGNCTVVANSASQAGGVIWGRLYNCVVYSNAATVAPNYDSNNPSIFIYSCTTPYLDGPGNITNEPSFVNPITGNYHLRYDSPCIDAGTNLSAIISNDLDGLPRPLDGNGDGIARFDIGAYEFDPRTIVPTNWFLLYGLDPTDPFLLQTDPDTDGHTTFQEWLADTDPTNAQSSFRIIAVSNGPPVTISFPSSSNRLYTLL